MSDNYPTTPVVNLTLYRGWGGGSRKAMDVFSGVIISKTTDLSGLKFDNAIEPVNSRADTYRLMAKILEKKKGHFIYDILKYDTHLGYDAYAIANMTMNPMSRLMPGEKELIGRFMTADCLEDEFAMDFDGDFVQILNGGLIQQMLEPGDIEEKKDGES